LWQVVRTVKMDRTIILAAALAVAGLPPTNPQAFAQGGVLLWTNLNPGGAAAIAVDSSGRVFVAGYLQNGTNYANYDYATLAYSNSGLLLWTNRYHDTGNLSSGPSAIAVDHSGNVFVTGSSFVPPPSPALHGTDHRYLTIAYSANGLPLWTNTYSGGGDSYALAVAADQNGKVFVTGNSIEGTNRYGNMTTVAYTSAGEPHEWLLRLLDGGVLERRRAALDQSLRHGQRLSAYSHDGEQRWQRDRDRLFVAWCWLAGLCHCGLYACWCAALDQPL